VDDNLPGFGEYHWEKRGCQACSGTYSGWAVGGGADGLLLPCGSNYPDNARSWMIYGPFSLADATAAELRVKLWLYLENTNDVLLTMASLDGAQFYGCGSSGDSQGWLNETLDLTQVPTLGDLTGESEVWVALLFTTNGSVNFADGAHVDDIEVRKFVPAVAGSRPAKAWRAARLPDTLVVHSHGEWRRSSSSEGSDTNQSWIEDQLLGLYHVPLIAD